MIRMSKAMTLLYLNGDNDEEEFMSDKLLTKDQLDLYGHYLPMTQVPLVEMRFYKNPVQLVEEVIAMTAGVNWRRQGRRPARRGDIICRGTDPWVLLKRSEITVQDTRNAVIPLRLWPNYAIHFMGSVTEQLKGLKL